MILSSELKLVIILVIFSIRRSWNSFCVYLMKCAVAMVIHVSGAEWDFSLR